MIVSPGTVYRWLEELSEGSFSGPLREIMAQLEQLPCGAVEVPYRLEVGVAVDDWVRQVCIQRVFK